MAEVSGKSISLACSVTFLFGVFVGWKLKGWRLRYLKAKRDYMARRMIDTQNQIDATTS